MHERKKEEPGVSHAHTQRFCSLVPRLDLLEVIYSATDDVLQGVQDQRCDVTIQAGLLVVVLHREDAVHGNPDAGAELLHLATKTTAQETLTGLNFSSQKLLDGGGSGRKRLLYLLLDVRLPVDEAQVPAGEGADQVHLGEDGQVRDVCREGQRDKVQCVECKPESLFICLYWQKLNILPPIKTSTKVISGRTIQFIRFSVCVRVCMYLYIYIYIHTHIHWQTW